MLDPISAISKTRQDANAFVIPSAARDLLLAPLPRLFYFTPPKAVATSFTSGTTGMS